MAQIIQLGSTTTVREPGWTGHGFSDPTAQSYWDQLPESLRAVARAELAAGNVISQILRNDDRGIVLLEFLRGPVSGSAFRELIVHRSFQGGNYCYDGTTCTVEDPITGCFLAFDDPDWTEEE